MFAPVAGNVNAGNGNNNNNNNNNVNEGVAELPSFAVQRLASTMCVLLFIWSFAPASFTPSNQVPIPLFHSFHI